MSNKVTAKMISEACGVNPSTVSRVLNNSSLISQETKEYVLKMALKMGYKVNDPFLIQKSMFFIKTM